MLLKLFLLQFVKLHEQFTEKTDIKENEGHFHKTTNSNHVIVYLVSAGDIQPVCVNFR